MGKRRESFIAEIEAVIPKDIRLIVLPPPGPTSPIRALLINKKDGTLVKEMTLRNLSLYCLDRWGTCQESAR